MKSDSLVTQKMKGFSLVELMVAITIGLIILVAVSGIFITSKKSYNVQDRLARLQENARFAMQFLMKDLRMAGYYGCVSDFDSSTLSNSLNSTASLPIQLGVPLEGLKAGNSSWNPSGNTALPTGSTSVTSKESACPNTIGSICTNTDAIAVLLANPSDLSLDLIADMAEPSSPVTVTTTVLIKKKDIVAVADCSHADIFQVTNVAPGGGGTVIQHAQDASLTPGNATDSFGGAQGYQYMQSGGKLLTFVYRRYYIGTGAGGLPSLFRDGTEGQQELVEGIENMRILYGVDTDTPPDGIPNVYLKPDSIAAADWPKVVSIRVGILAMTTSDKAENTDTDTAAYDIDGDGNTDFTGPGDRNKRRVFLATVALRNKHEAN